MTAKRVLMRPQGLRPKARAPTCPPPAMPLGEKVQQFEGVVIIETYFLGVTSKFSSIETTSYIRGIMLSLPVFNFYLLFSLFVLFRQCYGNS